MTSTAGCTNAVPGAQIVPTGYAGPLFRDPNGACYPYEFDGSVARYANYGYDPSEAAAIAFLSLFGILTLVHLLLNVASRRIWLVTTVIGGIGCVRCSFDLAAVCGRTSSIMPALLRPMKGTDALSEIIGWVGRYRSSQPLGNDYSDRAQTNFLMNVISLSSAFAIFRSMP